MAIVVFMDIPVKQKSPLAFSSLSHCILYRLYSLFLIASSTCWLVKQLSDTATQWQYLKLGTLFSWQQYSAIQSSKNSRICWHRNNPCFVLFVNKNHF